MPGKVFYFCKPISDNTKMNNVGWYIAIDGSTNLTGGILGLIYRATLFPKLLKRTTKNIKATI
jgi:hypothetical protein